MHLAPGAQTPVRSPQVCFSHRIDGYCLEVTWRSFEVSLVGCLDLCALASGGAPTIAEPKVRLPHYDICLARRYSRNRLIIGLELCLSR